MNLQELQDQGFVVRPGLIAGDEVYLIFPQHIGVKWTKQNLQYRSSIWTTDKQPVSLSFKKFFNWSEQPELTYTPFSLTANGGCQAVEKMDGSTLIISRYKGELIVRTRGTFDARDLDNGYEIDYLIEKYPHVFNNELLGDYTIICEWVTPENKIVLNYDEPDIILIGVVQHSDYSLLSQSSLDNLALKWGVKRPQYYTFNSIKEMLEDIPTWVGKEGVCLYCNYGQDIRKIKGDWYLKLHRLKSEMGSFERVVDFYFANGQPSYHEFQQIVTDTLDFEIWENVRGDASRILDGMKEVKKILDGMQKFVDSLDGLTRKEQAQKILNSYGKETNRSGFVFSLLDKKDVYNNSEVLKKLLYQVLKK